MRRTGREVLGIPVDEWVADDRPANLIIPSCVSLGGGRCGRAPVLLDCRICPGTDPSWPPGRSNGGWSAQTNTTVPALRARCQSADSAVRPLTSGAR